MREGRVSTLVIVGGNPAFTAPADLRFTEAMEKVALRVRLFAPRRRDLPPLPLAGARGPRARGVERRARLRRHGHDPAAAHPSALRRQVGARVSGRFHRAAGEVGPRHRPGLLARKDARRRLRSGLAQGRARRRRRGHRLRGKAGRRPGRRAGRRGRAGSSRRPHRPVPAGPDRLGRRLRQQRLAAGALQAPDEADLGQRRARRALDGREARRDDRRHDRALPRRPQDRRRPSG